MCGPGACGACVGTAPVGSLGARARASCVPCMSPLRVREPRGEIGTIWSPVMLRGGSWRLGGGQGVVTGRPRGGRAATGVFERPPCGSMRGHALRARALNW